MQGYNLFQLEKIGSILKKSFITLPDDQYIKDEKKFRKRRYSTGFIKNKQFLWSTTKENSFEQSETINKYAGNVKRDYEPLTKVVMSFIKKDFLPKVLVYLPPYAVF